MHLKCTSSSLEFSHYLKWHKLVNKYTNCQAQYSFPPGAQITWLRFRNVVEMCWNVLLHSFTFSSGNNSEQKSEAAVIHGFKVGLSTLFVHRKGGTPERTFAWLHCFPPWVIWMAQGKRYNRQSTRTSAGATAVLSSLHRFFLWAKP